MTGSKNKTLRIVFFLVTAILFCLTFLMYAFVQKAEAEKQVKLAEMQRLISVKQASNVVDCRREKEKAARRYQFVIDSLKQELLKARK